MAQSKGLIPVHGEQRHLREQAKFAWAWDRQVTICDNGYIVRLAPGPVSIIDEALLEGCTPTESCSETGRPSKGVNCPMLVWWLSAGTGRKVPVNSRTANCCGWSSGADTDGQDMIGILLEAAEDGFVLPRARRKDDDKVVEAAELRSAVRQTQHGARSQFAR
jgi:ribonuclease J